MKSKKNFTRREFIGTASAAAAFTVIPRHVLGGAGYVAPNDKLNLAYIGCGTQGIREMARLLTYPELQITSVSDPNKFSADYVDWSPYAIRDTVRKALDDPDWGARYDGIPGGRDLGKELVDKYYARHSESGKYKGCRSYMDYREQLEKETDIDAVKIMTPDHLHAHIAMAAMKKGKHVVTHKPIANRMYEARKTLETAVQTGANTHLLAWSERSGTGVALDWIQRGAIGQLLEIHNWSNRPVWPQWTSKPEGRPVPEGFEWDLWLGPEPYRPYSPKYTHAVFRGWYDFGGGSIADMGHYSLWPLFLEFGINTPPVDAQAYGTTTCIIEDQVSKMEHNNVAFPHSCIIRFSFPEQEQLPPFKLFWYDGGMKPEVPDELYEKNEEMPREGMMFVGDKGKILASFHCGWPRILDEQKMIEFSGSTQPPEEKYNRSEKVWVKAFLSGELSPGNFLKAGPVTETINLGAVALRAGKKVNYDADKMKITNDPDANQYLYRNYREGWEL